MRTLGFALLVCGCTSSDDRKLPSASFTPHLDSNESSVACGDDVALFGATTPDLRYTFTYNAAGALTHADGVYTAGGANDTIDYQYNATGYMTHMLQTRAWGDAQVEITAQYDGSDNLITYAYDVTADHSTDSWQYVMSNFIGPNQPTRETISGGGGSWGYQLVYDATNRLTQVVPDSGPATTYTYDDAARRIDVDTDNGAWTYSVLYDESFRETTASWGGSDPQAIWGDETYAWNGDRLDSMTYRSGSYDAPTQVSTIEVDTLQYSCPAARAQSGRTIKLRRLMPR